MRELCSPEGSLGLIAELMDTETEVAKTSAGYWMFSRIFDPSTAQPVSSGGRVPERVICSAGALAVLGLAGLDALAAIRRRAGLIAAGAAVVAVGWSYGAWSRPAAAEGSHPDRGVQEAGLVD
jgi:hypothetical protein